MTRPPRRSEQLGRALANTVARRLGDFGPEEGKERLPTSMLPGLARTVQQLESPAGELAGPLASPEADEAVAARAAALYGFTAAEAER